METTDGNILIATQFHHFMLIPLIYRGSYIVINGARVLRVPIHLKSILFAYLRAFLGVVCIVSCLPLIILASDFAWEKGRVAIMVCALGAIVLALWIARLSFRWGKASPTKAAEIKAYIHQNPSQVSTLEEGRVPVFTS